MTSPAVAVLLLRLSPAKTFFLFFSLPLVIFTYTVIYGADRTGLLLRFITNDVAVTD